MFSVEDINFVVYPVENTCGRIIYHNCTYRDKPDRDFLKTGILATDNTVYLYSNAKTLFGDDIENTCGNPIKYINDEEPVFENKIIAFIDDLYKDIDVFTMELSEEQREKADEMARNIAKGHIKEEYLDTAFIDSLRGVNLREDAYEDYLLGFATIESIVDDVFSIDVAKEIKVIKAEAKRILRNYIDNPVYQIYRAITTNEYKTVIVSFTRNDKTESARVDAFKFKVNIYDIENRNVDGWNKKIIQHIRRDVFEKEKEYLAVINKLNEGVADSEKDYNLHWEDVKLVKFGKTTLYSV